MKAPAARQAALEAKAVVLSASRRHVFISPDWQTVLKGTSSVKALDLTAGDQVIFEKRDSQVFVTSILPRKNSISRTYNNETRTVAVNLDRLFIVSAILPLYNTVFIDRVLAVAASQNIPCTLILNKIDLGLEETKSSIELYARLGFEILFTSAKYGDGMDRLAQALLDPLLQAVALAGISGVGKSTILNWLIPGAARKTAEVSPRTGQGRQTTTQAFGLLYRRPEKQGLLIIDLPGMHNFGISHLSTKQVAASFPEILSLAEECEFSDCAHVAERRCAVRDAVEAGKIARSRYYSYMHMLAELAETRKY